MPKAVNSWALPPPRSALPPPRRRRPGAALANRLSPRFDGTKITFIDGRKQHCYQPGFTLIAQGPKSADYSVSTTGEWMPRDIDWIEEAAVEIDPEAKQVLTASGKTAAQLLYSR